MTDCGQINKSLKNPARKPGRTLSQGRGQCLREAWGSDARLLLRLAPRHGPVRSHSRQSLVLIVPSFSFFFLNSGSGLPAPCPRHRPALEYGDLGNLGSTGTSPTPSVDTSFPFSTRSLTCNISPPSGFQSLARPLPHICPPEETWPLPAAVAAPQPTSSSSCLPRYSSPSRCYPRSRGRGLDVTQCACADRASGG